LVLDAKIESTEVFSPEKTNLLGGGGGGVFIRIKKKLILPKPKKKRFKKGVFIR
jgi:hypothetical protein